MTTPWTTHDTPLGELTLLAGPAGLKRLRFPGPMSRLDPTDHRPAAFALAAQQLDQYLAGDRERFDLDVDLSAGTEFQQRVWQQLQQIPYGTTATYGELAEAIGRPDRVRAVAAATGQTPVPIIIPCHRVIAADGALTGYIGGLERKRALLDLEARALTGLAPDALTYRDVELAHTQPEPARQPLAAARRHVLQRSGAHSTPNPA